MDITHIGTGSYNSKDDQKTNACISCLRNLLCGNRVFHAMLRAIVLLSLVFSTVGITITSCACPKMEMKQASCSKCQKDRSHKINASCCGCSKHFSLKTDFQNPPAEFHQVLQPIASFVPVTSILKITCVFLSPIRRDSFHFHSPGSLEKCALLSTFLI